MTKIFVKSFFLILCSLFWKTGNISIGQFQQIQIYSGFFVPLLLFYSIQCHNVANMVLKKLFLFYVKRHKINTISLHVFKSVVSQG